MIKTTSRGGFNLSQTKHGGTRAERERVSEGLSHRTWIVSVSIIIQTLSILYVHMLAGLRLPEEMTSRRLERPRRYLLVIASLQYKGV